ncbi:MAG: ECF-type sigma factor [Phycisphaerales bacterium]
MGGDERHDSDHATAGAADAMFPVVYDQLRALAGSYFRGQRAGHTLTPTVLVHEAYLRLSKTSDNGWESQGHFCAVAATAMRCVLKDYARHVLAAKRGGDWSRVTLNGLSSGSASLVVDPVDLSDALEKLAEIDERQSRIVELRFLAGLTNEEVAELLGVSVRTVTLDWRMARAWLRRALEVKA